MIDELIAYAPIVTIIKLYIPTMIYVMVWTVRNDPVGRLPSLPVARVVRR